MHPVQLRIARLGIVASALLGPMSCGAQWRPIGSFDLYFVGDSTNLETVDVDRLWRTAWLFLTDSSKAELRGRYTLDTVQTATPPNVLSLHRQLTIPLRGPASGQQISDSTRRFAIILNAGSPKDFITVIVEPPSAHSNRSVGYWCSGACNPKAREKGHSVILERQIK